MVADLARDIGEQQEREYNQVGLRITDLEAEASWGWNLSKGPHGPYLACLLASAQGQLWFPAFSQMQSIQGKWRRYLQSKRNFDHWSSKDQGTIRGSWDPQAFASGLGKPDNAYAA